VIYGIGAGIGLLVSLIVRFDTAVFPACDVRHRDAKKGSDRPRGASPRWSIVRDR
jgi:hypothetical protein